MRKPVLACAILLTLLPAPAGSGIGASGRAAAPAEAAPVHSLAVPGGAAALAESAGLDPAIPRARLMLAVIRVTHEWLPGVDAQTDARRTRVLNHLGNPGPPAQPVDDAVPLPLPAGAWANVPGVAGGAPASLLERVLACRGASLAYYGLSAMDGPTREYLAASPAALAAVTDDGHAPLLALYGRSLRVRNGAVDVPGGPDAVPLWEALAGVPVSQPAEFFRRVLDKDGGRLALLYDAVGHLDRPAREFVLGLAPQRSPFTPERGSAAHRTARFFALYRATAAALIGWDPRSQPFVRMGFDASQVLNQMIFLPDGLPAGPMSRAFWDGAFPAGAPRPSAMPPDEAGAGPTIDAAELVERICVTGIPLRRKRADAWAFAQRTFRSPVPAQLPDVVTAVRGFGRFPMLLLTLERMGITDPATYADAVRRADTLVQPGGYRAWASVTQFQSIIAIIERTRFARAIDAASADRLVRSACAVPVTKYGDYVGGLAGWLERWLLSSNAAPAGSAVADRADRPVENRLLAVLAGAVAISPFADPSQMPTVEWEGLQYRVDPAAETMRRLLAVRERQGGPSLDAVLALAKRSGAILAATSPESVFDRARAVADEAAALRMPQPARGEGRRADEPDLSSVLTRLRPLVRDRTVKATRLDIERVVGEIRRDADWYVAAVLCSIVYAPYVGPADSPALLGGDPSLRHDLGIGDARLDIRAEGPWRPPVESRDPAAGWRVTGSLLGLDLALGRLSLRRVASEEMPPAPRLSDIERRAVVEPVVLLSPFDQADSDMARLVEALARGRRRIAESGASSATLQRLAEDAGVDEWRLQMLPWMREHEPERAHELWSLAEVAGLGVPAGTSPAGFDAFGASQWSLRGELACRFNFRQPWTTLSGRKGSGMVPALAPDLVIEVAEALAAQKLPARLTVGVLSVAAQDLLDRVRVSHADDWPGLVAAARQVVRGRVEEYVAALTNNGPLVPIVQESRDAGR